MIPLKNHNITLAQQKTWTQMKVQRGCKHELHCSFFPLGPETHLANLNKTFIFIVVVVTHCYVKRWIASVHK